jgi:hypothetical protein
MKVKLLITRHAGHVDKMQSAAGASNLQGCSSRELVRRWNGLGQKQWTWEEDQEVFEHLATASLQTLDELSAPIVRVAKHIDDMSRHVNMQKQAEMMMLSRALCPALGCGLQQLGVGLRLYLDSGQLPAALTGRALDAIITLCLLASKVHAYAERAQAANPNDDLLIQGMRPDMAKRALETGMSCIYRRRHSTAAVPLYHLNPCRTCTAASCQPFRCAPPAVACISFQALARCCYAEIVSYMLVVIYSSGCAAYGQ